jgi:hypothetical protein
MLNADSYTYKNSMKKFLLYLVVVVLWTNSCKTKVEYDFEHGSNISLPKLSNEKINDLYVLGKVWGFLKYYHPAIATGKYNWDYELFKVLPKVLNATSLSERNNVLSAWIDTLGKVQSAKMKMNIKDVKLKPELSWITDANLGEYLSTQLSIIKDAERPTSNYYVKLSDYVGVPEFTNEKPYAAMKYPDAGFRLLSLYRYWNIIEYYFPYKNLIGENWDAVLKEFINLFANAANELEYKKTVLLLIARVHDTHAMVVGPDSVLKRFFGSNAAPLIVTFVQDRALVTGYYHKALGEQSGLNVGDVIEKVNNKTVRELLQERLPFTSASNSPTLLRNLAYNLLRTNDTALTVEFSRNSVKSSTQVKCIGTEKIMSYIENERKDTCFKILKGNIAYLYPASIRNKYFPQIIPELLKAKGLIIDFRCYPKDFLVLTFGKYLFPLETTFVKYSNGSIASPGLFTFVRTGKIGTSNKDHFKNKVIIIVNETTQSSAEYHVMGFRTASNAMVIGSTTAGADGNVSEFTLPGGVRTMMSGIGIYYPDGRETQRIGIVPDIEVKPTIEGIKMGKDELLEKAISLISNK